MATSVQIRLMILARANGAVELDAEESLSRSIGLTWGIDTLSITVDYYEIDTDIQFNISDNWNVAIGANNLLDEYPDESIFDISYFGNLPYDGGVAPQGNKGRFAYLRSTFNF